MLNMPSCCRSSEWPLRRMLSPTQCRFRWTLSSTCNLRHHAEDECSLDPNRAAQNDDASSGQLRLGQHPNAQNATSAHLCALLDCEFAVLKKAVTHQISCKRTGGRSSCSIFP